VGGRVLLAEDDRAVRDALQRALELEGHQVRTVADGAAALAAYDAERPEVLLLDWMMPVLDGLEVCRRVRELGDRTPILILSARTEVGDRVAGLDAGADDYLPKPFALDELLARVRALLRRTAPDHDGELHVGDLTIDPAGRRAWRGERELDLTKTEFELLEMLARNTGIVCTHQMIYERVWGYDFGPDSKALAVYIGYLRRKLEAEGEPRVIFTVRGVGYTAREP
jgi:two-component system, OmpR family, response regulator MprA